MKGKRSTKNALISSILVFALCVSMLIGATFAWFTDTASTSVNKIQAGTLEVGLEMKQGDSWVNAEGETLGWVAQDGRAQNQILWEPGCTYKLPTLKITNNGNLALQFKVLINGISGDLELLDALEFSYAFNWMNEDTCIESGAFNGSDLRTMPYEIPLDKGAAADAIGADDSDFVNGYVLTPENPEWGIPMHVGYYTLQAHMKEEAGNEYQGKALENISITVVATQVAGVESDSFDDIYDKDAEYAIPVATADDLAAALASGNDVILTAPVQMPDVIEIKGDVTIYGSEEGELLAPDNADRVINVNENTEPVTLTLSNVDVVGPTTGTYTRGVSVYANSDVTIIADNSSISANYYALNIAGGNENVDVIIRNTTLTGWCALQTWSAGTKATFENCTLIGNNDKSYNAEGWNNFATVVINTDAPGTELTFKNCRIEANQATGNKQYLLSVRASGAKVTLDGCSFYSNGSEIEDLGSYISLYAAALDLVLTIDGEVIPIS